MARRFRSGGRSPLNPWFRFGELDVTTTVLAVALVVVSFIVYAIDKNQLLHLDLYTYQIRRGQVWRVATWPLANRPSLWSLISLAFLWYFGRQVESELGRFRFAGFLAWCTIVPAAVVAALNMQPISVGLGPDYSAVFMLEVAVLVAFAAEFPGARFFFNISARVIAMVFVGIQLLQLMGDRYWDDVWMLLLVVATSLVAMRAYGFASDLTFIPKLSSPFSKKPASRGAKPAVARPPKKKRRGQPDLKVVPTYRPATIDRSTQDEIDTLLDKIAAHGLNSLTADERQRLDQASRRLRGED